MRIKDLKEKDLVSGVYFCVARTEDVTKAGKKYYSYVLSDKTGKIDAKAWDIDTVDGTIKENSLAKVNGEVTAYQGNLQLKITSLSSVREEVNISDYLVSSKRDLNEMKTELVAMVNSINNPNYKALLNEILINDRDRFSMFCLHPGAKSVHHACIGGLLEHTLGVASIADNICKGNSNIDRDLLITAALLHDIGKVDELGWVPGSEYSEIGKLMGHITLGVLLIEKIANKLLLFQSDIIKLHHCILAHHGKLEWGSPVKPQLLEAVVLHYCDNFDSTIRTGEELLETTQENAMWSGYSRILEASLRKTDGAIV